MFLIKTCPQQLRIKAIRALGKLRKIDDLLLLTDDETIDTFIKVEVAEILIRNSRPDEAERIWQKLTPDILSFVRDGSISQQLRIKVIRAFGELGKIDDLLLLADDETIDTFIKVEVAEILIRNSRPDEAERIWQKLTPDILSFVRDGSISQQLRTKAIRALNDLGRTDVLLSVAVDKNFGKSTRIQALGFLIRNSRPDEAERIWQKLTPDILSFVRDGSVSQQLRTKAIRALNDLGRTDDLLSVAVDKNFDKSTRIQALGFLIRNSRPDEVERIWQKLTPDILSFVRDGSISQQLRTKAIRALNDLGRTDDLLLLVDDETVDMSVKVEVAVFLIRNSRPDETERIWQKFTPDLLPLAKDRRLSVLIRKQLADILVDQGQLDNATQVWLSLASDNQLDKMIRKNAIKRLSSLGKNSDLLSLAESRHKDKWMGTFIRNIIAHKHQREKRIKKLTNQKQLLYAIFPSLNDGNIDLRR